MSVTEQIEEKLGLKIEDLNAAEKETYFKMLDDVQSSQMSPEKLRDYITVMREEVTKALVKEPEFIRVFIFKFENRNQILLKARLQNYILLESFLLSPQKAEEALNDIILGLKKVS